MSIEELIEEPPMINQEPIQESSEELIEESIEDPPSIKQVSQEPDLPDFQTVTD